MKKLISLYIVLFSLIFTPSVFANSEVNCTHNQVKKVEGSTVVCVNLNQNQSQSQSQENNNNQTNNNNNNQTLNINSNPIPVVNVVGQAPVNITQLPRTGLPIEALILILLLPVGIFMKFKFSRKAHLIPIKSAKDIWVQRQFKF